MKTIVTISLALLSALIVAGSTFKATEGQNATIYFNIDKEEKPTEVRITFKQDNKEKPSVIAQHPWNHEEPPPPGVSLLVEKGLVSVIIQNVNISRNSGLYTAQAFFGKHTSEDVVYFCKCRRKHKSAADVEGATETSAVSMYEALELSLNLSDPVCAKERIGKAIAVIV